MNIIVCIKQVPDTSQMKFDSETKTIVRENVENIVNPFDLYAVEESLRIKEKFEDSTVTAICMGPEQAESALREVISMGVDKGILVSDKSFAASDTLATSYVLSEAIKKRGPFDLILFGKMAIDGDTAQVGPGVASILDIPQITFVRKIEEISDKKIIAERAIETGYETIESDLPCVLTCIKELNEPRLPSLRGKIKAKKEEIPLWNIESLNIDLSRCGLKGSPTMVIKAFAPTITKENIIFKSENQRENVGNLISKLKEKSVI
ncbi:MAG: electron transfer flavoprotein subunit beta [bacterium (Candidatus Stahlbacteria) CG23_combo_of_CG06-09_8_20_14_all_34_7]|nr:MAG: electron transfer flavoprotein subunit beta [bacterium (Candidatus Stahlbacteria) CG23_combo_of_CG06-09_8_20_14_all_34_7]